MTGLATAGIHSPTANTIDSAHAFHVDLTIIDPLLIGTPTDSTLTHRCAGGRRYASFTVNDQPPSDTSTSDTSTSEPSGSRYSNSRTTSIAVALTLTTFAAIVVPAAPLRWVALVVAALLHATLIRQLRRGASLDVRATVAAVALLLVTGVAVAPQRSKDIWSYATDGSMVVRHHRSPYTHRPRDIPGDAFAKLVSPGWRSAREVYGPVFHGVSVIGAHLYGQSPLTARLYFQGLAALSAALALLLLWRVTHEPATVAVFGLCPAFLVMIVHEGHNDAMVGVLVLLTVVTLRSRRRSMLVNVPLLIVALIKLPTLLFTVMVAMWLWSGRGLRTAVAIAGTVGAGLVIGYLTVGGMTALRPTLDASNLRSGMTLWTTLARLTGGDARWTSTAAPFLVVVSVVVVVIARRGDADPTVAVVSVGLVFVLGAAYAVPWYYGWVLPAAALVWRSRTGVAAFLLVNAFAVAYGTGHPLRISFVTPRWSEAGRIIWSVIELMAFSVLVAELTRRAVQRHRVQRHRVAGAASNRF